MERAIDGELLELEIANIANKLAKSDAQKALMGRVMYCVEHMPTLTPPNEPLTLEDAKKERYIWFTPLNDWAKVTPFGVLFFGSEELMNWETLCEEWGYRFKAYRRPPEVSP